jgi:hypothetical protein
MQVKEAVKRALAVTRQMIAASDGDERSVYEEFFGEFEAEMEGWKMRVSELESEQIMSSDT